MRLKVKVAAGFALGQGHKRYDTECQDRTLAKKIKTNKAFIALADGAGSAEYAHIGAEYVVEEIFNFFKSSDPSKLPVTSDYSRKIINVLSSGIERIAIEKQVSPKQFASTLLFVLLQVKNKQVRYFAGHIGDGLILVYNKNKPTVLSYPDQGEYASSTHFVTSNNAEQRLRLYSGVIQKNTGFLLMSDGTAESLYRKKDQFIAPACDQIFKWGEQYKKMKVQKIIEQNLTSVFINETQDDCSLALASVTGLS